MRALINAAVLSIAGIVTVVSSEVPASSQIYHSETVPSAPSMPPPMMPMPPPVSLPGPNPPPPFGAETQGRWECEPNEDYGKPGHQGEPKDYCRPPLRP